MKWLNTSRRTNCEICLFDYKIKLKKPPVLLFSEDPIFNRNIMILGVLGLVPLSPVLFYTGLDALDVYYAVNILYLCLVFAYVKYVKVFSTLAFWKMCLTTGFTVVAVETGRYDHFIFDYGVSAILALACFCKNRFLRPINNEDNTQNE